MKKEKIEIEIRRILYEKMDGFLVEGDKPREIGRLNLDRHLFVDTTTALILELLKSEKEKLIHDHEILINTILDTKNEEICQEKKIAKEVIKKLAQKFGVEEKQIRIALKDLDKKVATQLTNKKRI